MSRGEYMPRKETADMLELATAYVQSVAYAVTARWLFYRLIQDGTYSAKSDYKTKFLPALSKARKSFYNGWRPDSLADDTREAIIRGAGFENGEAWAMAVAHGGLACSLDKWLDQPNYVQLWFEAKAMRGQFEHYTKHITLVPFGGDPSIPYKWTIAMDLEDAAQRYPGKPIKILYFGDLDEKGLQIEKSATADIRDWAGVEFDFTRCGLNPEHLGIYDIPENDEKPGTYQWEALPDVAAMELITGACSDVLDTSLFDEVEAAESEAEQQMDEHLQHIAEVWE